MFETFKRYSAVDTTFATFWKITWQFSLISVGSIVVGVGAALAGAALLFRADLGGRRRRLLATPAAAESRESSGGAANGHAGAAAASSAAGKQGETGEEGESHFDPGTYEVAVILLTSYLAYLVADVLSLSGIFAVFFAGVTHSHYSYHNVSPGSQSAVKGIIDLAAHLS
jgi:hypothetical protein